MKTRRTKPMQRAQVVDKVRGAGASCPCRVDVCQGEISDLRVLDYRIV